MEREWTVGQNVHPVGPEHLRPNNFGNPEASLKIKKNSKNSFEVNIQYRTHNKENAYNMH